MNARARPLIIVGVVIAALAALAYCKQASLVPLQLEYERHLRIVADVRAIGCQLDRYKESAGAYPSDTVFVDIQSKIEFFFHLGVFACSSCLTGTLRNTLSRPFVRLCSVQPE
jgi:hypothetical protein